MTVHAYVMCYTWVYDIKIHDTGRRILYIYLHV